MAAESQRVSPPQPEAVFNTFRRKPLRPFYSLREIQIGAVIVVGLAGIAGWVAWRGAHPDPALFTTDESLLTKRGASIPVYKRAVKPWAEPGTTGAAAPRLDPFPAAVTDGGWQLTGAPQMFDAANLYEKIDGREGFYKSFGFQKLYCLALKSGSLGLDIELFDLGTSANALGAFGAEISNPQTAVQATPTGLWYVTRNGGFLTQGRYYARLIGSDDAEPVRQKIAGLREAFSTTLPGEPMPWAYALLAGKLKFSPAAIQYQKENAFSFGFAAEFYSARLPGADAEIFISRRSDNSEAKALAAKLSAGFASFGKQTSSGLIHNDMINAYDGVRPVGEYVIGVRLASSEAEAREWMGKLETAIAGGYE